VSKFVGKFRKNKNYNDDYNYDNKRHRDEHSEIKKLLSRDFEEYLYQERPQRSPTKRTR
jgi:predicted secreted Zn-dependent protease